MLPVSSCWLLPQGPLLPRALTVPMWVLHLYLQTPAPPLPATPQQWLFNGLYTQDSDTSTVFEAYTDS